MDDDRLASELQRRASGASPRPGWAQHDLLPAVWHEIDVRPQRVLASRWSPLAGVATLVVALLVLVVAVPRLAPQPPSATSTPANPLVLTTADFASRLAAGELDGKTALVDGAIATSVGPAQPMPSCSMPTGCYMGELWGSDPPISVAAPLTRTTDLAHAIYVDSGAAPDGWMFWRAARPAVQGMLLLAVMNDGSVQFIGIPRAGQADPVWSVADVAALDINSLGLDEVVLVDGWLGGTRGMRCRAPFGPREPSLPSRYCSDEWLASDTTPTAATELQVQAGAYSEFAPDPSDGGTVEPRHATYAVAPRLEGWCQDGAPPCWQWNVVARVDANAGATPTPSPYTAPEPTVSPGPLSVSAFAAQLAAGTLDGKTVLVDGGIVAYDGPPIFGSYCGPNGPACIVGQLEGVTPRIVVSSPHIAVASSDDSALQHSPGWPWWMRVAPPIHGTLLFSVGDVGGVKYIGRVLMNGDNPTWSVGDAAALDINSLGRDEVVLVDGWLVDTEPPGSFVSIDCVPRQFPDLDGLPSRYCQPADFLSSEQPTGEVVPDSAARLQVQRAAAKSFGGRNANESATYAIAPRLYGGGCSAAPPCWLWNVVARVDTAPLAQPSPTPTLVPATVECTRSIGRAVTVIDETGAVASCRVLLISAEWPGGKPEVRNLGGDHSRLQIWWVGSRCARRTDARFARGSEGYEVELVEHEMAPGCEGPPLSVAFEVELRTEIDAATVSVTLTRLEPTPPATPSVSPTAAIGCEWRGWYDPQSTEGSPEPAPSLLLPSPVFIDQTGLVISCFSSDRPLDNFAMPVIDAVSDLGTRYHINWTTTVCDTASTVVFAPAGDRFSIEIDRGTAEHCNGISHRMIAIELREPVDSRLIDLAPPMPQPTQSPAPPAIQCNGPGIEVSVLNPGDLVTSCRQISPQRVVDPKPGVEVVADPGDPTLVRIRWDATICTQVAWLTLAGSPDHAVFDVSPSSTCILSAARVVAVEVVLTRPVKVSAVQVTWDSALPSP